MKVFSNTTPLLALSSIGQLSLLPAVFSKIYVVDVVVAECAVGGRIVVPDLTKLSWVQVVISEPCRQNHLLLNLDQGEKHTLDMAYKMCADYVIIDEKMGRNIAEYMGLSITGTLGVLLKAKQQGHIFSFSDCAKAMQAQGIRYNTAFSKNLLPGLVKPFN
jgi:predicted nucleic acid-binding protein